MVSFGGSQSVISLFDYKVFCNLRGHSMSVRKKVSK